MLVYTRLQNSNFKSNLYLKVVANRMRICPLARISRQLQLWQPAAYLVIKSCQKLTSFEMSPQLTRYMVLTPPWGKILVRLATTLG